MTQAEIKAAYERTKARMASMKAKAEEALGEAVATVETVGAGFLGAYGRGRFGEGGRWEVAGVEATLAAGVILHATGFLGLFGRYDEHAHNIGNGLLTEYAVTKGYELGVEAKQGTSGIRELGPGGVRHSSAFERDYAMAA